MTSIPTGPSRAPSTPLKPSASSTSNTPNAGMIDGVLHASHNELTPKQRSDYAGVDRQVMHITAPVKFDLVPCYNMDTPAVPLSQVKTPMTENSKRKWNDNAEFKEVATTLFAEKVSSDNLRTELNVKPRNKQDRDGLARLAKVAKMSAPGQVEQAPAQAICLPLGAGSEMVAQSVVRRVGRRNPLQTLKIAELDNRSPTSIADKKLLQQCLTELCDDFVPDEGASASDLWRYLRGVGDVQLGGEKPADTRNFLISVIQFKDGSQLKFFSVSGLTNYDRDAGFASYKVFGECSANGPAVIRVPLLANDTEPGNVGVVANLDNLEPVHDAKFVHLAYDDIHTKIEGVDHEVRVVPRLLFVRKQKQDAGESKYYLFDRARDTEYVVLTSLDLIRQKYEDKFAQGFDIVMFSKLKMCASCESAGIFLRTEDAWGKHGNFRIYGSDELPRDTAHRMVQSIYQ